MKRNGFTIVELIIVMMIFGILGLVIWGAWNGGELPGSNYTMTVHGVVEESCVNGYSVYVGPSGQVSQKFSAGGVPERCQP